MEIFITNIKISFTFGDLQLEQTKFLVFYHNFQIPCVFPDRELFWPFFMFSLCSGYPERFFFQDILLKYSWEMQTSYDFSMVIFTVQGFQEFYISVGSLLEMSNPYPKTMFFCLNLPEAGFFYLLQCTLFVTVYTHMQYSLTLHLFERISP